MYNVRTLKYMLTLEIRAYSEIEILRNIFQKCNKNYFIIKKTLPLCLVPTVVMTFIALVDDIWLPHIHRPKFVARASPPLALIQL